MSQLDQTFTLTATEAIQVINGLQTAMALGGTITQVTEAVTITVEAPAHDIPHAECTVKVQRNPIVITRRTIRRNPDSPLNN